MGNEQTGEKGHLFRKKAHPFQVNKVKLNTKIQSEGVKFEPSPYNIQEQKFVPKPMMDKEIRNSEFCYVPMPELSNESRLLIRRYLRNLKNFDDEYDQINKEWRMTRYHEEGHFVEHCDREKLMQGRRHFGTEIFLPPLSESKYEGGELKITYDGKVTEVLPDEELWTHIILPLNIEHQVKKVSKGVRISYVKEIWVQQKDQPIVTDQDREIQQSRRARFNHIVLD